jgi:predicted phosphoribosyltransferase
VEQKAKIMSAEFANRREAGRRLAAELDEYTNRPDVIVLALPRGGVPVGFEVAATLNVAFDVFVVRKLGVPGHEELAMGAIASGGTRVLNRDVIDILKIPNRVVEGVTRREREELERREHIYRAERPPVQVKGKTVILVDDGIATGATMKAAIAALRQLQAGWIIVATPTAALDTLNELRGHANDIVAVIAPEDFGGVGRWYDDFSQTTDVEVCELLEEADRNLVKVEL